MPAPGNSPTTSRVSGTQSIARAVALLRAAAQSNRQGSTVAELASRTGIDRSTTHRMLKCLAKEGLLGSAEEPMRYFLGPLAYELGLAAAERLDLRKLCRPAMARIAELTGDTVFLMLRDGYDSVCADRLGGHYPVKTFVVDVGTRRPLGIGAGSLAILASLPPEEAEAAILANECRIDQFVGMSAAHLRRLAAKARTEQRAIMDVIDVKDVQAIAVPIRAPSGYAVGALSIAAIASRMTARRRTELFGILQREAGLLTGTLGSSAWLG